MVAGAAMPGDLTDREWLSKLREIGESHGFYSSLGRDHAAVFVEESHDVLFVAFETLFGIRSANETGMPMAFDICGRRGWSHLSLIAEKQDWFRSRHVWNYIDRLVDYGFFEDFDKVVFYGAGLCGYAAAAFSVAAPGSSVILVSPQATLERSRTEWDSRFPNARRLDFTSRYGYAPEMVEAADQVFVIYDPDEIEDAMHASLFRGPNVHRHRYRRGSAGAIDADLRGLGLVAAMAEAATRGRLTPASLAAQLRNRRYHVPYLRALLARVLAEDRPELTVMLCKAVLKDRPIPRFQHHLEAAERKLAGKSQSEARDEAQAQEG